VHLRDQQADEEWRQYLLRETGDACEAPGEPERQELLRLLEEEIASVREEFAYAEKANEERAAIERDACLAPEGEMWRMLLRQEAALDRSIDRKVRILLRLRKESTNPQIAPDGRDQGGWTENMGKALERGMSSQDSQGGEALEHSKMKKQCGNVLENKGSCLDGRAQSWNVTENKGCYVQNAGMSLKTKGVIGYERSRPTTDGHSAKSPGYSSADGQKIGSI
jgi:hypothetical protein